MTSPKKTKTDANKTYLVVDFTAGLADTYVSTDAMRENIAKLVTDYGTQAVEETVRVYEIVRPVAINIDTSPRVTLT